MATGRLLEFLAFEIFLDPRLLQRGSMRSYHLIDEFSDQAAEQAILTSLAHSPGLYGDLVDLLTPEVFTEEVDTWQAITLALETGKPLTVPTNWLPAPDPHAAAHRLVDRIIAVCLQRRKSG